MARKGNAVTSVTEDEVEEVEAAEVTPTEVTYSAKDLAKELGTDAKSFRRWLRAHTADRANKGGRWVFSAEAKEIFLAAYRAKGAATEPTITPDA